MGVMNSGREALITVQIQLIQSGDTDAVEGYIQLGSTAKKLCKPRTFISTSHKWFTKELHWNSHTFTCTVHTDSLH